MDDPDHPGDHGDPCADPDGLSGRAAAAAHAKGGLDPVSVEETEHFRLMREFSADPKGFVEAMMEE